MYLKKIGVAIMSFLILIMLAGCVDQEVEPIGESPVTLKTTTKEDIYTVVSPFAYTLSIPEDWDFVGKQELITVGDSSGFDGYYWKNDSVAPLKIDRYLRESSPAEMVNHFKALFAGNTKQYEEYVTRNNPAYDELLGYFTSYSDFHFRIYQGTHGKIVELRRIITHEWDDGKTEKINAIEFYREDIPYVIFGELENLDDNSFDIALWIIDSLEIRELDK